MGILLQVRDVPPHVHRTLKSRAAASGVSLSEYVRAELAHIAARPTIEELEARLALRPAVEIDEPSETTVRHLRDEIA